MGPPADAALFMHGLFTGALLPPPLRAAMRERHPVEVDLPDRPWRTAGYGLGLMMDIASPHGLCIGHSGQGPDSVAAAYHFPDLDPPLTVAAFAPTDDQGIAERAVLERRRGCAESARTRPTRLSKRRSLARLRGNNSGGRMVHESADASRWARWCWRARCGRCRSRRSPNIPTSRSG